MTKSKLAAKLNRLACLARKALFNECENKRWMSVDFTGLCAYGAIKVFNICSQFELKPRLAVWLDDEDYSGHCYVLCEGYIVDVTATQFGLPSTQLVTPLSERSNYEFWAKADFTTDDGEAFIDYLLSTDWCVTQIPPLHF